MTQSPTELYARSIGPADKPLVVFCHGLFGQGKNFGQIAKALQPDFRCLLLDLPNHGRSSWCDTVSYVQMADAVAAHLENHEAHSLPCAVVGHSMGGKVAMRLALFHPALVSRLVVVDMSPVENADLSFFQPIFEALTGLDMQSLRSRQDADERLRPAIPDDTVRAFLLQNLRHELHGEFHWQMNLAVLARQRAAVADWPATQGRTFPGPVLWLRGGRSRYVLPAHVPLMRDLFPRAELVTIEEAGHWVHSEQPERFVAALREGLQAQ